MGTGGYSSLQYAGFSLWWFLLLQSTGSRVSSLQQLQFLGFGALAQQFVANEISWASLVAQSVKNLPAM